MGGGHTEKLFVPEYLIPDDISVESLKLTPSFSLVANELYIT